MYEIMKQYLWLIIQYILICIIPAVFMGVTGETLKEHGHMAMATVWNAVYVGWLLAGTIRLIKLLPA